MRSLPKAVVPPAIGSDGPDNPFLNVVLATTYKGKPDEPLTREQAIVAYTLTSAYAEGAEKDKGSLEPGELADLAVLSQDIFEIPADDLRKTESVMTVVGGKIVYDAANRGCELSTERLRRAPHPARQLLSRLKRLRPCFWGAAGCLGRTWTVSTPTGHCAQNPHISTPPAPVADK